MKKIILSIFSFAMPLIVGAASITGSNFKAIANSTAKLLINSVVPLLISLSFLWFLFGLAEFIRSAGDTKALEEGRNKMLYGVIGLFVIFSIWALVGVLRKTFGI